VNNMTKKEYTSKVNGDKSRNGQRLEKLFTKKTGINKLRKKDKPTFNNRHGKKEIIDFDYVWKHGKVKTYIDITTSYRSTRAKQKAYNGMLLKRINNTDEVWLVSETFKQNGKTIKILELEGLDKTISFKEAIKIINDNESTSKHPFESWM